MKENTQSKMSEDFEFVGESADGSISSAMRKAREEQENKLIELEAEVYAMRSVASVLKDAICEQTREIAVQQQRIAVLEKVLGKTLSALDRIQFDIQLNSMTALAIVARIEMSALGRVFRDEGLYECSFIPASLKPLMGPRI